MILSDREIQAAIEFRRLIIEPPPSATHYDSTTVDLTLDRIVDLWEFPPPTPGLGNEPKFSPGHPSFRFKDIEQRFTKEIEISPSGFELPPVHLSNQTTGAKHFVLGWTTEKIYLPHTSRLCARVEGKIASVGWVLACT